MVHARLIREKAFLRRLYLHYYDEYEAAIARATPGGIVLEVGAGGGFYRETCGRRRSRSTCGPARTSTCSGRRWRCRFATQSTSAILLLNVLHHLPDPRGFFRECQRVLKPGGRVCLIEPYAGPLSRRLIRPLHHEPWDETGGWTLAPVWSADRRQHGAAVESSSFAIAHGTMREFPELADRSLPPPHRRALPALRWRVDAIVRAGALFTPLLALERLFAPAGSTLASMMTVELVKR